MPGLALVSQLKRQIGKDKVQVILWSSDFWVCSSCSRFEWGVFWSVWAFVFDILCVRVTAEGEVGYGTVTVGIIGG